MRLSPPCPVQESRKRSMLLCSAILVSCTSLWLTPCHYLAVADNHHTSIKLRRLTRKKLRSIHHDFTLQRDRDRARHLIEDVPTTTTMPTTPTTNTTSDIARIGSPSAGGNGGSKATTTTKATKDSNNNNSNNSAGIGQDKAAPATKDATPIKGKNKSGTSGKGIKGGKGRTNSTTKKGGSKSSKSGNSIDKRPLKLILAILKNRASMPPNPSEPPCDVGEVIGFTLIDTVTNQDIEPLADYSLAVVGDQLSIRADVFSTNCIGSVVFDLNSVQRYNTDPSQPYSLGQSAQDVYQPVPELRVPGTYTITATPYTRRLGLGQEGIPLTMTFRVLV